MAHQVLKIIKAPIVWILFSAFLLRLWGITYGLPLFLVNDETPHVYGALKMIELKTLIPAFHAEEFKAVLYYPLLLSYFYLIVLAPVIAVHYLASGMPPLETYRAMLALDPSFLWVAARVWMAAIGVSGVYLTYRISYHLSGTKRAALFAAAFLALSFYHLQLSHNVRHWMPASVLLAFLWERALAWRGQVRPLGHWLGAGALAGIAAGGVNTAAAVGLIPLVAARVGGSAGSPIQHWFRRLASREVLAILVAFALVALAGIALYPYGLTRAEGASGAASDVLGRIASIGTKSVLGWLRFIAEYLRTFWEFETPLFLFSLAGMGLLWLRRSPSQLFGAENWKGRRFWIGVTVLYAIAFFTLLYLFDDFTVRGVVLITPVLAAFAGYAADRLYEKVINLEIKKLNVSSHPLFNFSISFFFFLFVFGWQLATDLRYQQLLSRPDTRLVARKWLLGNLPAGSRVLMDAQYLRLPNTPAGVRLVEAIDPGALRAADRAVIALGPAAPHPAAANLNLDLVSPQARNSLTADTNAFLRQGFTHLVIEYRSSDAIRGDTRRIAERATLIARFNPWRIGRSFAPDGSGKLDRLSFADLLDLERFGLFVDVYRLP
ncbi:MAG: hypothetical protein HY474_01855 [Candidatus Sungbacteria bacterium]|uniref:Glycosyltransferase RgtA/B/C/D-like domain-containing protein n=1 Tax=Candidatus Sungiibacteriota bacterium TaxID=2750080 RepID=A0A933DRI1_9BACT|nr:hypothetical protein [Candidatus Sungbacteria bacterium]